MPDEAWGVPLLGAGFSTFAVNALFDEVDIPFRRLKRQRPGGRSRASDCVDITQAIALPSDAATALSDWQDCSMPTLALR